MTKKVKMKPLYALAEAENYRLLSIFLGGVAVPAIYYKEKIAKSMKKEFEHRNRMGTKIKILEVEVVKIQEPHSQKKKR